MPVGTAPQTRHVLRIDGWHPCTVNRMIGRAWQVVRRLKKLDREQVCLAAMIARMPMATGRRRLTLTIVLRKGQRRCDPDAYDKSLLDALVHAGLLVNDSPVWLERGETRYERGEKVATIIALEDVE